MTRAQKVSEYFSQPPSMLDELKLSGPWIKFHWANWKESCLLKKALVKKLDTARELQQRLDPLKETPIWIRSPEKSAKMTLYDLYEAYCDSRLKMNWDELFSDKLISFCNEAGPYTSISSKKWLDEDLVKVFFLKKLLTQETHYRTFRLSTDLPAQLRFDHSEYKAIDCHLHQISKEGIMVRFRGKHNVHRIECVDAFELVIRLEPFYKVTHKNFEKSLEFLEACDFGLNAPEVMRFDLGAEQIKRFNKSLESRTNSNDDIFLFFPYEILFKVGEINPLRHFVEKMEQGFIKKVKDLSDH